MPGQLEPIKNLIRSIGDITAMLIPILIAVALVTFFYGLVMYIFKQGTGEAKGGKDLMIWGLVALFVMISVYGIIRLAQNALGVDSGTSIGVPRFPGR